MWFFVRWPWPSGDTWVIASETCAFDLIDATYVRDVEPGEMIVNR